MLRIRKPLVIEVVQSGNVHIRKPQKYMIAGGKRKKDRIMKNNRAQNVPCPMPATPFPVLPYRSSLIIESNQA
jgi:hypothetical protein